MPLKPKKPLPKEPQERGASDLFPATELQFGLAELKARCNQGLESRILDLAEVSPSRRASLTRAHYELRLRQELRAIESAQLSAYLIAASELVASIKEGGPIAPPAQGPICGSIAAWCLGLTDIDPVRHGLLFERFLRPESFVPATILLCLPMGTRAPALRKLRDEFPLGMLGHPCLTRSLDGPAAIREAALRQGIDPQSANVVAAWDGLSENRPDPLQNGVLEKVMAAVRQQGGRLAVSVPDESKLLFLNSPASYPNHLPPPLSSLGSMRRLMVAEAPEIPRFDLIEFQWATDLSRNLRTAMDQGLRVPSAELIETLPTAPALLNQLEGLWPFHSPLALEMAERLGVSSFSDLCIAMAVSRPQCSPSWDGLIRGKQRPEEVKYLHAALKPILEESYGMLIYQEQVARIGVEIFAFTLHRAMIMLSDLLSKKGDKSDYWRQQMAHAGIERGLEPTAAEGIANQVVQHGKIAGQKANSAARAYTILLAAWLRAQIAGGIPN